MSRTGRVHEHRLVIVAVICVVVAAAGIGAWLLVWERGSGQGAPVPRGDGPTLHEVLASVNGSVANESGGPWTLFSVYGIAAQTPFNPNLIGYARTNLTVNSCSAAFNGLTLWNGTIPLFNGTLDSGTAPFWQLGYFSNSSQEILLVTDVLGRTHLYLPIAYPSSCMPWYDFPGNVANWTSAAAIPMVDSSVAARAAWNAPLQGPRTVGNWVSESGPTTEIMTFGPGVFMGFGDVASAYGVYFDRCGEVGVTGVQPLILVGIGGSGQWAGTSNLTHNCALIYSGQDGYDSEYDLLFSPPSITSGGSTTLVTAGFQVAIASPNGTLGKFYDEVGLANWMTSWNVTSPSGQYQPLATPSCRAWVPTTADCNSNVSGWYVVITSASGEWVNSYGLTSNGTPGWSIPVTALVSHQQLVVVCPSSWNVSGDKMTPASTVSVSHVIGSFTI